VHTSATFLRDSLYSRQFGALADAGHNQSLSVMQQTISTDRSFAACNGPERRPEICPEVPPDRLLTAASLPSSVLCRPSHILQRKQLFETVSCR